MFTGCGSSTSKNVVIYASVDQVYAEPILAEFEQSSGIRVLPVFDVEAAKTTGLVNRLIAEKDNPQADVFWNGEFVQTLLLKKRGALAEYASPAAEGLPARYADPQHYWHGLGGRLRVLIANKSRLPKGYPRSLDGLAGGAVAGEEIAIAHPLFGTSATHAAALYAALGPEQALGFYTALKKRGVRVVDGNSVVRDLVANGEASLGLTDSDDACGAVRKGAPVEVAAPDQEGRGALVIPGSVALVKGAPHPEEARKLIDYLLSAGTERRLIEGGFCELSLRSEAALSGCLAGVKVKAMEFDPAALEAQLERSRKELGDLFIR